MAALAVALLAALLVGEIAVRVLVGAPLHERLPLMRVRANPYRGWEMVPGEAHYTYEHLVHVNALGLRGPEVAEKEPGELRVLFLGDSLTYGQGVGDDETMPAALERALLARDPRRRWTVVNGGVRAYGTAQELGMLEELGARIRPDVVVLGWYWNDLDERPIELAYQEFLPRGAFEFDGRNERGDFSPLRWKLAQIPRMSALAMFFHDLTSANKLYTPEVFEQGLNRLERLLEHFRELCTPLAATPLVALIPDRHRLEGHDETRPFEERCAALADERGIAALQLLPALGPLYRERGRLPVVPYDGHYDADANRAMGERLAERVLELPVHGRAE